MKKDINDSNWIRPMPNALVSCKSKDGKENALAIGFISNAGTDPLLIMVAVRPSRYSNKVIRETKNFVVNLPTKDYQEEFSYLGSASGFDEDKLENINTEKADIVDSPILSDCPINYECTLTDIYSPGSHDLFIGKVEKVHCDEEYLNDDGTVNWDKINLL
ncbi:MAG: flavin reductase family protein [Methanosphaera sp.]|mgnify:CR=1 FL=1|jgi:flavin reductase (DIM6/NTAB) family NADH-FMN oxidoreductase RutF|nr:flavin reductase family protein [Methanobacteriaceae archaeon]MDY2744943.1 flavin reductase family protein [Methanosphaera sp.]